MVEAFLSQLESKLNQQGNHNPRDRDLEYMQWQQKVSFLSTISNYVTMFFLVMHPLVMVVAYDFWANYHYLMIVHSGQQMLLGAFIWALPDPKYQHWL